MQLTLCFYYRKYIKVVKCVDLTPIPWRPFFLSMHEQPVFHDMGLFQDEKYPIAEHIARQGLYLSSGLTLTESQVDKVVEAVRAVLA